MAPTLPQPARDEIELSALLAALGDPMRRAVVVMLAWAGPGTRRDCSSFGLPVSKQTRTHHFRVLRASGLISLEDLGNRRLTSLRRADIDARWPGLLDAVVADGLPEAAGIDPHVLLELTP